MKTPHDGRPSQSLQSQVVQGSYRHLFRSTGFLFLVIVEGLAAKNEVMLDGFNGVIALDDMIGKLN